MTTIASEVTSLTVVYSTVYSDVDQRKHQSSASLAFVWGIHRDRWIPRTKGQLRGKCFHLMTSSWNLAYQHYITKFWKHHGDVTTWKHFLRYKPFSEGNPTIINFCSGCSVLLFCKLYSPLHLLSFSPKATFNPIVAWYMDLRHSFVKITVSMCFTSLILPL